MGGPLADADPPSAADDAHQPVRKPDRGRDEDEPEDDEPVVHDVDAQQVPQGGDDQCADDGTNERAGAAEDDDRLREQPAQLVFVDLAGGVVETVVLPGRPEGPVLSADESRVYLLDPGDGSNNPQKNVDGTLQVVSMADRSLELTQNAGREPGGLSLDTETGRLFLVNEGPPGQKDDKHGELLVFEGGPPTSRIHVGNQTRLQYEWAAERITRDHSVVEALLAAGAINAEQAEAHPDANRITRALGIAPEIEPELGPPLLVEVGDTFLLCSDGLSDLVADAEIGEGVDEWV